MPLKKSTTSFDTDELLSLLDEPELSPGTEATDSDILNFISFYNIQPGKNLVSSATLYNLYNLWALDPKNKSEFTQTMNGIFFPTVLNKIFYYSINENGLEISKKMWKKLKEKKREKTLMMTYQKHFEDYLKCFGLQSGTWFIDADICFQVYQEWAENKKHKITNATFKKFCKVFFKFKYNRSRAKTWIGINKMMLSERIKQLYEKEKQAK